MKKLILIILTFLFLSMNTQANAENTDAILLNDQIKKASEVLINSENKKDLVKVIAILSDGDKKGDVMATHFLAVAYHDGRGVEKDINKAFLLFYQASNKGYKASQAELCELYSTGKGTKVDIVTAKKYCLLSANQDWALGQQRLAKLYEAEKNYVKAEYWLEKAADNGDVYSQKALGFYYLKGDNMRKNIKAGVYWLEKASLNGDREAAFYVAKMHQEGKLIPKNNKRAARLYKIAAKNNHVRAQFNYGLMLLLGEGVSKNLTNAYKWMRIVNSTNCKYANIAKKHLLKIRTSLSQGQIKWAKEQAHKWAPEQELTCGTE